MQKLGNLFTERLEQYICFQTKHERKPSLFAGTCQSWEEEKGEEQRHTQTTQLRLPGTQSREEEGGGGTQTHLHLRACARPHERNETIFRLGPLRSHAPNLRPT